MQKYLNRQNLGWLLTILMALSLIPSIYGKLIAHEEVVANFGRFGISGWELIIGLGELLGVILFVIPKTMRFGALVLSAYFGGAIMAHMTIPEPFPGATAYLIGVWVISYIRGNDLFLLEK